MERKQFSRPERSRPKTNYLDFQAYLGATKHFGGMDATKDLLKLCQIRPGISVLDIGCGVGATSCFLAKQYGCQVVGIDLRSEMILRAREKAKTAGVEGRVSFRVTDAQNLPFASESFDLIISESVATFIEDKKSLVTEYARVTKQRGFVGLNEEIWVKSPPSSDYKEFMRKQMDVEPEIPLLKDWEAYLQAAGLQDIAIQVYETLDPQRESSQKQCYGARDYALLLSRMLRLYVTNQSFRAHLKESKRRPKGLFGYLGYGIFVGRKI
jgi:ubiquinone/menaquinone biosynthesis C-methylase UbiE